MKLFFLLIKNLRKNKFFEKIELVFFSFFAFFVIKIIYSTLRVKRVNFLDVLTLRKNNKRIIFTFYHGEQFVLVPAHQKDKLVIMTSLSRDGELQTWILKKFGYDIVRGSTKKGYTKATLQLIDKIKNGKDVAFAVDGPKGPAFKVKPGAVFLAQKTNVVLVPVRVIVENKIQLKNWDKYIIPLPFSKVKILYGKNIIVSKIDSIKQKIIELEKIMKELVDNF